MQTNLQLIEAHVAAVYDVAPTLRRLILAGADLATLKPPPGVLGPYLKLHLPDATGRLHIRTYSLRHLDETAGRLHIDINLHGGDSVGSRFACTTRAGAKIAVRGPCVIPAPVCDFHLVAGDQTAVGAISHICETVPAEKALFAFVEVDDFGIICELMRNNRAARITCLHRPRGAASRLAEALRAVAKPTDGPMLLWAGAEASIARSIRKYARAELRLPQAQCPILNYWKAGKAEGDFDFLT
jgi:NADPH-dependent ferric siderophore reductase